MEERQVSVEGATRPLPSPFFVIATQNPSEQLGTHPLPESQLDRFAMRLSLGYPDPAAEKALLTGEDKLTTYTFNTGTAQHRFCSVCGIKGFYVPRSKPDGFSVNVRCLDEGAVLFQQAPDIDLSP